MAFSAYEFLNFVLPGAVVIAIGFNDYTDELVTTQSEVLELLIFGGASFVLGHICAGLGSFLFRKRPYPDPIEGADLPTLLSGVERAEDGSTSERSSESSRKAAERLLELLHRDDRTKMLGQQENLHRNLAMASLLGAIAWGATITFERNSLGWPTPVVMLFLSGFFLHRFFHYRRGLIEHLALAISMLPTAVRYSDLP